MAPCFQDEEGIFRRAPEPDRRTAPPLIELAHLAAATGSFETNTARPPRGVRLARRPGDFADFEKYDVRKTPVPVVPCICR